MACPGNGRGSSGKSGNANPNAQEAAMLSQLADRIADLLLRGLLWLMPIEEE
ncbi:hypothetical protein dqs_0596 [Azoarcus olearius]|uniref:hypothetical protein n=1 Tax=Azoarcus sp. (strain BH72) TaxID=418699 RepID=UPI0008061825|nr:hypothetical protein [Azoarcus olearius]ANQ83672.1 hypothetical protein dqs_0596 [Azoarcus olearius]